MKKIINVFLVIGVLISLNGCYMSTIDSGEGGLEVISGKVQNEVLSEGFHFSMNPLTELEVYNVKVKALIMNNKTANKEDSHEIIYDRQLTILTENNMEVPLDMVVNYSLNKTCAPKIRKQYGVDGIWDEKVVIPKVRSVSRGVIGSATVYDLNVKREIYSAKIKTNLNKEFVSIFGDGCVDVSSASIQNIYIPSQLKNSIMKKQQMTEEVSRTRLSVEKTKAEATKRIEKERGEAEAKRVSAQGIADARIIIADSIAKSNDLISSSINDKVLAYKALENQRSEIDKWDGIKPKVLLGSGSNPLVQIPETLVK